MQQNLKSVLVTGGAGYIGSHTCKALAKTGYHPITYDNLSTGHESAVKWGPFEKGDILDAERLNEVLGHYEPGAVLHFAALAYVGESVTQPGKYWQNNVVGSLSLIEAMAAHKIDQLVLSSTCSIYGVPETLPLNETHTKNPINPYGTTKLVVETMLGDFADSNQLDSVSLRYFNAAGADPDGEIGEDHDPETHLIPLVLMAANDSTCPLTVFGNDYQTKDGSCVRDYVHVTDLADAHVRALRYLDSHNGSHAFNLGNDTGHSVFEILDVAQKVSNRKISYSIGERRPGDPPILVSQSVRAKSELGWTPQISDIESIIETAWDWLRK
jgi:UDP-arabinose 4-epimerase